jgi:hypothetical protein
MERGSSQALGVTYLCCGPKVMRLYLRIGTLCGPETGMTAAVVSLVEIFWLRAIERDRASQLCELIAMWIRQYLEG